MNLKRKRKVIYTCIYTTLLLTVYVNTMDIGSDTAVTRFNSQVTINDGDRVAGFAALDGGFFFSSPNVTATFDSFFQVSGPLEFNGGTLNLDQDLIISNGANIGPLGNIVGRFHTVDLATTVTKLPITLDASDCLISFLTETTGVSNFETCAWAFDNVYIAVGTDVNPELLVYEFDGSVLTLVDSVGPPGATRRINAVLWRPNEYFLAMTRNGGGGDELFIYEFNTGTETLTQIDSNGHGGQGRALAWRPDGDYLVEGTSGNGNEIILYEIDGTGNIVTTVIINIAPNRDVQFESADFDSAGDYFGVGLNTNAANPTVLVYEFTPAPLGAVVNATAVTPFTVRGLSWNQTTTNLIAVGQQGTTGDRVILYDHDGTGGTLTQVGSISDFSIAVESVQWNPTGDCLAVGTVPSAGVAQLRIYCFDPDALTFDLVGMFDRAGTVNSLNWSDNNSYLALADDSDTLAVYDRVDAAQSGFVFSNLNLKLNNTLLMNSTSLIFSGLTTIDGQGNLLDLSATSTLIVDSNSSLLLKNIRIQGAGLQNISGTDATSTITCQNVVWSLDEDFTFTQGSLTIVSELLLEGDHKKFTYRTDGIAIIEPFSSFILDDGITFSYDPSISNKNLLQFFDESSLLRLTGGTLHASTTGLNLFKGSLRVDNDSCITSDAIIDAEAISFGDGLSSANNFNIEVEPAALLQIKSGRVLYNNV